MAKTIEIVTFRLIDGVTEKDFVEETTSMERGFLGKLQGFMDRDTGLDDDGNCLVVLHWESAEDAQASMDKFVDAPETKPFTSMIDMGTFQMKRYTLEDHYQ